MFCAFFYNMLSLTIKIFLIKKNTVIEISSGFMSLIPWMESRCYTTPKNLLPTHLDIWTVLRIFRNFKDPTYKQVSPPVFKIKIDKLSWSFINTWKQLFLRPYSNISFLACFLAAWGQILLKRKSQICHKYHSQYELNFSNHNTLITIF